MSTREAVQTILRQLPRDVSLHEVAREIEFIAASRDDGHSDAVDSVGAQANRVEFGELQDVDSLAGSLGQGHAPISIEQMNAGAKAALARAGRRGLTPDA